MKILTYTSLFPNEIQPAHGVFVYQRMVHFARRQGNSVVVIAPVPWVPRWISSPSYRTIREIPKEEKIGGLTVYHPRYPLMPRISMPLHGLLMFLGSYGLARKLQREHRFAAIDAHYIYPDGFAAALLGRLLGLPVVVSARGTDMNLFPQFRLIRPLIKWTLSQVVAGIGVCAPLRDELCKFGLPPERASVIGNGIDLLRFQSVDKCEARRHLDIPEDVVMLVAVGALIPRKGFHLLIEAFARIARTRGDVRLYIVGEGDQRNELHSLVAQHAVGERVFLVGARKNEDLRYWYSAADLSCLVSSREGWPNVLLESLACGTPVVATRIWGVPEVIVSPELGVLVDQTVDSIAQGLTTAMQRTWSREMLIGHARLRTWDVVAEEVEQCISSCLHPASRG